MVTIINTIQEVQGPVEALRRVEGTKGPGFEDLGQPLWNRLHISPWKGEGCWRGWCRQREQHVQRSECLETPGEDRSVSRTEAEVDGGGREASGGWGDVVDFPCGTITHFIYSSILQATVTKARLDSPCCVWHSSPAAAWTALLPSQAFKSSRPLYG